MEKEKKTIDILFDKYVKTGKSLDFDSFFNEMYGKLFYWAQSFVKCDEISEEIVNNAFVKLWQLENKKAIKSAQALLYTYVKNECLDHLKSLRNRTNHISFDESYMHVARYEYSPEYQFIQEEEVAAINTCIENLSSRQQQLIILSREHQMSTAEISQILGVSERTVQRIIKKTLDELASKLNIKPSQRDKYNKMKMIIFYLPIS